MAEFLELHRVSPQPRLIRRAAEIVRGGGLIAYPTDSCYAFGWHLGDKGPLERVRRIRQADRHHHFTMVCASLADIGRFALIETWQFRILKACLPGPYTFLLRATRATPRRLQHERRRTIGVRIPDHPVPQLLVKELGADELCIKDMGGFMPPSAARALVTALRKEVGLPVVVHTHSSGGLSTMTCLAAAEAGFPRLLQQPGERQQQHHEVVVVGIGRGEGDAQHQDRACER
jgi:hypothetical protein